jgi:DNA-binding NarL/FixJ family response regulator
LEDLRANAWIVLVDDEESIRSAVSRLFASRGYQHVTTCQDGQQVLELLLEPSEQRSSGGKEGHFPNPHRRVPDCIVSDIRMPNMDGMELLKRIRSDVSFQKIAVVLLTAKGLTQDRIAGYDSGADAYLAKPFQPEELLAIVETVIQRNAVWDDLAASAAAAAESQQSPTVIVEDLQQDLATIKDLLLKKGGAGIGNGFVDKDSNVFFSEVEQTVLELLAEGCMTKEIAAATHMSTRRIEQLLTQMFRKVNVKNRTELIKWAVSTGHVE